MNTRIFLLHLLCCFLLNFSIYANHNPAQLRSNKTLSDTILPQQWSLSITTSSIFVLETTLLWGLQKAWYGGLPRENFHFFNDGNQWGGMDKIGHATYSYQLSKAGVDVFRKTGISESKALFWGSSMGFLLLFPIEVMDGFASDYGASAYDLLFNFLGSGLVFTQQKINHRYFMNLKYSFHRTEFAKLRPGVLGENLAEEALKDYNGQTYWASINLYPITGKNLQLPVWLNLAFGYGVDNMLHGSGSLNANMKHQLYFSLDLDLVKIPTRKKMLRSIFYLLNFVKIPFPALEWNDKNGIIFHPVFF